MCTALNYNEHLLIFAFVVTGCVSITAFASLVAIPAGIRISAVVLKTGTITAGIKMCKSIIKKKKKKYDKIVLLAKIPQMFFIDSFASHNEFVLINNVLREDGDTEKK